MAQRRSWTLGPEAELDEAITWFRRRLAVPREAMEAITENARRSAFWMARVNSSQRAARVQKSLQDALAHGMDFETWRKTAGKSLQGIPKAHLETTFRNWTQTSYNNARINYLSNPQVVKRRPYWVFDAVIDSRTTRVCQVSNGTVLPAGHPWFLSHTPPLHHNCRSAIRGLTQAQAAKLGIRQRAPRASKTKPDAGFGRAIVDPWEPSTRDFPAGFKPPKRPDNIST